MTNILPISNAINVSVQQVANGLPFTSVNNTIILTTEKPNHFDEVRKYDNPTKVGEDFGTDSDAYKMANIMYSQPKTIRTGKGTLFVASFTDAISAKNKIIETVDLSGNITNFKAIQDGKFSIALNGNTAINITDLNFEKIANVNDIAKIIRNKINNHHISVIITVEDGKIKFSSQKYGLTSNIVISASTGSGTDITAAGLLDVANIDSEVQDGENETGENIIEAIDRLKDKAKFYFVLSNLEMQDSTILSTAQSIQSRDMMFYHAFQDISDLEGVIKTITDSSLTKTRCLLRTTGRIDALLNKAGHAGVLASVDYNSSNSSITMNYKSIVGLTPDALIDEVIAGRCKTAGADFYGSYGAGGSVVCSGKNNFDDNVIADIWSKKTVEEVIFNALKETNTKMPQTEEGMRLLKSAIISNFINVGLANNLFSAGQWNSTETFGNESLFKQSVLNNGYYIYSMPVKEQPQVDRTERKAPTIQIAVKRAGAIHSVDVIISIEN